MKFANLHTNQRLNVFFEYQNLLIEAQELAARLPSAGISPEKLIWLSVDELMGTLAYLKRLNFECEA